eukprot:16436449-Heterocapsa_arctica.AAC.1
MMWYNVWIDRVRWCVSNVSIEDYPCEHCGARFWILVAASKHVMSCTKRRTAYGLSLGLNIPPGSHYHEIS